MPRRGKVSALLGTFIFLLSLMQGASGVKAVRSPVQSYWGMNAYISKRERIGRDNLGRLADIARSANVAWTREELPWALMEPRPGQHYTASFDQALSLAQSRGLQIIGMLLTTPPWARDAGCAATYWCPPASVDDYARWAGWMADHYSGRILGVPRIAAWEIWNEPNDAALWSDIPPNGAARKLRYGQMLVAAYRAIKASDPQAIVLTGGTYMYDGSCTGGICDGFNFFNAPDGVFKQLPSARQAFDIFAIHPYIPTSRPETPESPPVISLEGRIRQTRTWLNRPLDNINRPDAPIWITEIGWCTDGGACPAGVNVSEDTQANYLTRALVIAQQNGVAHTSWFQLEDAFNDPKRLWSNAAIIHDYNGTDYPTKPAYDAYRTVASTLGDATPGGPGPLHTHSYNPVASRGDAGTYDYRYQQGNRTIDVLWQASGSTTVSFPLLGGTQPVLIDRDGSSTTVPPGDHVTLQLSERPQFVVQSALPLLEVRPAALVLLATPAEPPVCDILNIMAMGGRPVTWKVMSASPWLAASPTSGSGSGTVTICGTPGTNPETLVGSVELTDDQGGRSISVPVRLVVSANLFRIWLPVTR
ncbi:MAG: beta-galactosidase [Herpetosiphon sp.]